MTEGILWERQQMRDSSNTSTQRHENDHVTESDQREVQRESEMKKWRWDED